jgi:S1-C subfamily serine protease
LWGGIGGGAVTLIVVVGIIAFSMGRSGQPDQNTIAQNNNAATNPPDPLDDPPPSTDLVEPDANFVDPASSTAASENFNKQGVNRTANSNANNDVSPPDPTTQRSPANQSSTSGDNAQPENSLPQPTTPRKTIDNLADLIEVVEPSVVRIDVLTKTASGNGSGFVGDRSGIVVTNYHVMVKCVKSKVTFVDGETAPVLGVLFLDQERDIAVLQIDYPSEKLRPIALATKLPRKGERVAAFGAPLGLDFSATEGIISSVRSAAELEKFGLSVGTWLQTTSPISPGNSGGPLVNMQGEVVAANTFHLTGGQNLNFAISSIDIANAVKKRWKKMVAIRSIKIPEIKETRRVSGRPHVVDATGTERATELLAELDEVNFVMLRFDFDPTGQITQLVHARAVAAVERAKLKVGHSEERSFVLVTMQLRGTAGTRGTQELVLSAHVIIKDLNAKKQLELVKVLDNEERVGTVALKYLAQGNVPRSMDSKIKKFFAKFVSDIKKAKRAAEEKELARKNKKK